ncbi:MAG: hypothetical protein NTX46_03665 [Chloroflexi bacterium]|nr:hypothetical protein [Chloroflexota bacterium]
MALLIRDKTTVAKCWACGLPIEINENAIVLTGIGATLYLHSNCAAYTSRQVLRDVSELHCLDTGIIMNQQ